ncbi:MAG: hypothetical protein QM215_06825 [Bacillota bacterium]|nr:hypothetical protein [Eubacteriales bacterium]MDD3536883.1 hypothetical protein [Eubacteriales bacterium]MDI9492609.1 hypothetical protein [Bacillota bacterium]NLV70029.1 hypothetical protein [Clostridiales bacterium]
MNRKTVSAMLVLLVVSSIALGGGGIFGADSGAGTAADPVVTKSYVDELFASLSIEPQSVIFEVVEVDAGTKLIGGAGAELILRGGKATAIDNGIDGLSDLTAGRDLKTGNAVSLNHLLLVPKEDGRGLYCETRSWVMVKGAYTLL